MLLWRNPEFLGDYVSHYPNQSKIKLTNTYWLPTNSDYSLEQAFQDHLLFEGNLSSDGRLAK